MRASISRKYPHPHHLQMSQRQLMINQQPRHTCPIRRREQHPPRITGHVKLLAGPWKPERSIRARINGEHVPDRLEHAQRLRVRDAHPEDVRGRSERAALALGLVQQGEEGDVGPLAKSGEWSAGLVGGHVCWAVAGVCGEDAVLQVDPVFICSLGGLVHPSASL